MDKRFEDFPPKAIHMTNNYMKRCSESLVTREMKSKASWDVKTYKGSEVLPYLHTNKLACYSFRDAGGRPKTFRSKAKDGNALGHSKQREQRWFPILQGLRGQILRGR